MVTIGIDAHKRSHTVVAVDEQGRQLAGRTVGTTSADHLELVAWAAHFPARRWAVEDCRHLSRRLERDLLAAGERIVRVPPKLMANARDAARSFGKSDPIDALAVARAALREPDLPVAKLDGPEREVRLLVDHREDLVGERTRMISRLRWHLHELDPGNEPAARTLNHLRNLGRHRTLQESRRLRAPQRHRAVARLVIEPGEGQCCLLRERDEIARKAIHQRFARFEPSTAVVFPPCGGRGRLRTASAATSISSQMWSNSSAGGRASTPAPRTRTRSSSPEKVGPSFSHRRSSCDASSIPR